MCSSSERLTDWQPPPPPGTVGHGAPAEIRAVRPVWVLLDEVVRHDPAVARTVIDGLDLTGRAKGFLYEWRRSSRGDWVGVVNYEVHYADGREATVWWHEQLVPGYALLPRSTT